MKTFKPKDLPLLQRNKIVDSLSILFLFVATISSFVWHRYHSISNLEEQKIGAGIIVGSLALSIVGDVRDSVEI